MNTPPVLTLGTVYIQGTTPVYPNAQNVIVPEVSGNLLQKFISKKTGRPFKAFLVLGKDGKIGFEFEPRPPKAKAADGKGSKAKEPPVKLDFSGQEPLGQCPKCGGRVFEGPADYVCEKSQAEAKPCKFKTGKVICQQLVDRAQRRERASRETYGAGARIKAPVIFRSAHLGSDAESKSSGDRVYSRVDAELSRWARRTPQLVATRSDAGPSPKTSGPCDTKS